MKHLILMAGLAGAALSGAAQQAAAAPASPVVVELFTSQSCSSCPPADALLAELSRTRPDILALDMHVTYWDRLGWKDPYSLPEATQRQRGYAGLWEENGVYTPQLVAGGRHQAIGSDRAAVRAAIEKAKADAATAVPLQLVRGPGGLQVQVGAGADPGRGGATLLLVGYDAQHTTSVRGGENSGRTLTEVNVVRSMSNVGKWRGQAVSLGVPVPAGERAAVLLQAADGRILGAATAAN